MRRPPAEVTELARTVRRILGNRTPARIRRSVSGGYRIVVGVADPAAVTAAQVLALQSALAGVRTWGVTTKSSTEVECSLKFSRSKPSPSPAPEVADQADHARLAHESGDDSSSKFHLAKSNRAAKGGRLAAKDRLDQDRGVRGSIMEPLD